MASFEEMGQALAAVRLLTTLSDEQLRDVAAELVKADPARAGALWEALTEEASDADEEADARAYAAMSPVGRRRALAKSLDKGPRS